MSYLSIPTFRSFATITTLIGVLILTSCDSKSQQGDSNDATDETNLQPQVEAAPLSLELQHLSHPPAVPRDAIRAALASAELSRSTGDDLTILKQLLHLCAIPEASQVLVFSKTSQQARLITPQRPRAIYFSDDCYVGWVPGGMIEISDTDPTAGTGFFVIDLTQPTTNFHLANHPNCLNCHAGSRVNHKQGLLIRSIYPDDEGFPLTAAGSFVTGHDSPLEERWGGWYVTGEHGQMRHMGNVIATDHGNYASLDKEAGANLTSLADLINTDAYLRETSDIVALMVLEHQVQMHNLLTQSSMHVRRQYRRSAAIVPDDETFDPHTSQTLMSLVEHQGEDIVQYLLFSSEVKLTSPIIGSDDFQRGFRMSRRESESGDSLKDFDLQTHLFKQRCSYMIYSRAFELMHPLLKAQVYLQLWDALTNTSPAPDYAHLGSQERTRIIDILRETREGLPTYWFESPTP